MRMSRADGDADFEAGRTNDVEFRRALLRTGPGRDLVVLDIDGTVVVINANLWPEPSAADRAEFAADVLDSIRIDPRALPNVPGDEPLEPGTYYVDEVNGTPTPRIFATLDSGWSDLDARAGWAPSPRGGMPDEGGIGHMAISNPVAVFSDACHPTDGFYPGPVAHRRRIRHRAQGAAGGMGRRDRPVGHLRRRLRRQSIPTHGPRRDVGLHHQGRRAQDSSRSRPLVPELGERRRNQRRATHRARSRPCGSSTSTARSSSSARNCGRGHRRRLTLISPTRCSTRSASTGHERRARRCAVPFIAPDHVVIRGRPTPR